MASSIVVFFKYGIVSHAAFSTFALISFILGWAHDITTEGLAGKHNLYIMEMFKFVFMLFLFTEFMFFFAIFWAYFDTMLNPTVELGGM